MNRPSVLIIGTDDSVRKALAASVERAGCHATVCNEEPSTITATLTLQPDVILLCDNSDETSRAIRDGLNGTSAPVIVQAPRLDPETFDLESNSGQMQLTGFAEGISALASSTNESYLLSSIVTRAGLFLDRRSYHASIDDHELKLTLTEFNILWQLASADGAVLSRRELCEECRDSHVNHGCRAVDVHVRSLRLKLGDRASLIETIRSFGYRFGVSVAERPRRHTLPTS